MSILVNDPEQEELLLRRRREFGGDLYDEVWEGVYMMVPLPNNEHQDLVMELAAILRAVVPRRVGRVLPGANVSDLGRSWKDDFRVPDVAVFLAGGHSENRRTHWKGGDFFVEIASPGEDPRKKLPFYARVGVEEVLVVDRKPWRLELYRLAADRLVKIGASRPGRPDWLESTKVPLRFRMVSGDPRPQIEVARTNRRGRWLV